MVKLKSWYINFIEKDRHNILEKVFYCFLCLLSYVYGGVVWLRNFFYNKGIIPSYSSKAKVISVGNLSWSGSGKTPLSIWLYENLAAKYRVAILRRGYGDDENKMILERTADVFCQTDRYSLAKKLESSFNLFILDDGFQFRRLKRDINIVVRGSREFRGKHRLIPAYFFREPLSSLARADILLLNYKDEINEPVKLKKSIESDFPYLKVYFSSYKLKRFIDLEGNEFEIDSFRSKKIACFCAIGYPQGFINGLKALGLDLERQIIYPDHYTLSKEEFRALEEDLLGKGIKELVITYKDRYHLPEVSSRLSIFIMEVELQIEQEEEFLSEIIKKLD